MNSHERQECLQKVTKRLVIFTGIILMIIFLSLYGHLGYYKDGGNSYLALTVFIIGLIGGFVSIQQRLPKISLEELRLLSNSWVSVTLIPINGGIFALVLMLIFLGGIIQGSLFPEYPKDFKISDVTSYKNWFDYAYPVNGNGVAKLLFWSFVAGFSERFVPQVIIKTTDELNKAKPPKSSNK